MGHPPELGSPFKPFPLMIWPMFPGAASGNSAASSILASAGMQLSKCMTLAAACMTPWREQGGVAQHHGTTLTPQITLGFSHSVQDAAQLWHAHATRGFLFVILTVFPCLSKTTVPIHVVHYSGQWQYVWRWCSACTRIAVVLQQRLDKRRGCTCSSSWCSMSQADQR